MTTDARRPNRPPVAAWRAYVLAAALFALIAIGAILAEGRDGR
jgi:heme A synthase